MYDIDPAPFIIRFTEVGGQTIGSLVEERDKIEREMQALSLRWTDITMTLNASFDQSQTIASAALTDNDFWGARHRTMGGSAPKVARANGTIEQIGASNEVLHDDDGA